MSIDFHRLMEPINNNRLIFIDYIDCFPMIDFHRLDRPGKMACYSHGHNLNVVCRVVPHGSRD